MTQETAKMSPTEIRDIYNGILDAAGVNNREMSEMVKVMDLGDTKKIIIQAMGDISKMSRQKGESAATRWLRKFGMGRVIDKVKDGTEETVIEGSSVAEVSQRLLDAIVSKRDSVSNMVEKLFDLKLTMVASHASLKAIVGGIDEFWDQYDEREQFHLLNIKAEVLETMSFHEDNILAADGTVRAAEQATTQISQMIPKLRSQINDSMIIRGSLNELEELTSICDTIGEVCAEIRIENRDKMEETLMNVLNQSVVSDKQIALIDKNSRRQIEIQQNISNRMVQIHKSKGEAVQRLQAAVERNSDVVMLASKGSDLESNER